ncbi:TPA: endonuclease/exonuclease/phosphatase family protein [Enterobacter cloacae]
MREAVSIAWWNTGISPAVKRDRSTLEELGVAFALIANIMVSHNIDILCLGEISPTDIKSLEGIFSERGFLIYDGTFTEGSIKHDMCILIKLATFTYIDSKSIVEQSLLGAVRAGQEVQLMHNNSGDHIFFYISHWPMRGNDSNEEMPKRYELGKALRGAISRCIEEKSGKYFILLGDYNDDPFNKSLTHALGATRDRDLVIKKDIFLYNPFWNFMGASVNFPSADHNLSTYGTYYYSSGVVTRWHTFDQIIFSSSFISGGDWKLLEDEVKIINDEAFKNLVTSPKTNFDHLPVIAVITRG